MGLTTLGPPSDIVLELAQLCGATNFVETGTFHGGTTRWAAAHFDFVFTIEKAESLYRQHNEELSRLKGVSPHLGDSRLVLPSIVSEISNQKAVFWLDGHWSGGETAGVDDECPLLDELACLSARKGDVVLIDDARLFLSAPPLPHKPSAWPTISDVVGALAGREGNRYIQVIDDVIFAVPNEDPLRNRLIEYAQERSNAFWENFVASQRRNERMHQLRTLPAILRRKIQAVAGVGNK